MHAEACIDEIWYNISIDRMMYNSETGLDVNKGCKK